MQMPATANPLDQLKDIHTPMRLAFGHLLLAGISSQLF